MLSATNILSRNTGIKNAAGISVFGDSGSWNYNPGHLPAPVINGEEIAFLDDFPTLKGS